MCFSHFIRQRAASTPLCRRQLIVLAIPFPVLVVLIFLFLLLLVLDLDVVLVLDLLHCLFSVSFHETLLFHLLAALYFAGPLR